MLFEMSPVMIAAAVIPAIILMAFVYKKDKLDRESPKMLVSLVLLGALSTLFALILELLGTFLLQKVLYEDAILYKIIENFLIVGLAEEGGKYIVLKKRTWKSKEYNCQFDGVVYAVFVSLGFALWENIKYVALYGWSGALTRAFTAVPGHACFGVFMGIFYGMAKRFENNGEKETASKYRVLSIVIPVLIHGFYDFCLSDVASFFTIIFIPFILGMFAMAFVLVRKMSKNDAYIGLPTDAVNPYGQYPQYAGQYPQYAGQYPQYAGQYPQYGAQAAAGMYAQPNAYGTDAAQPTAPQYGAQADAETYPPYNTLHDAPASRTYDVLLTDTGMDLYYVAQALREMTGMETPEIMQMLDHLPAVIAQSASAETAQSVKAGLEALGATVEIR